MSTSPFRPEGIPSAIPLSWEQRLDVSDSEAEVIELAREYVAQLENWEIAALPAVIRPQKLVDALDVTTYAFDLVRYECDDEACARLVHKLAAFFSRCSMRLSELLRRTNAEDGTYAESA